MSKKPDSSCVLSIIVAAKLCTILSLLIECLRFAFSSSPISEMRIQTVEYGLITMILSAISVIVIVMDLALMFSTYCNHFNVTKRLIIADLWIQLICFIPVLIWVIVFIATTDQTNFKASWTDDFEFMQSLSHKSIYLDDNVTDSAYYDINDVAYLDEFDNSTAPPEPTHLAGIIWEEGTIERLLQRMTHVEKVQRKLKCCGLEGPDDWLERFSGPIDPETQATTRFLWWSNETALVDVPKSCCRKESDGVCALRYGNNATLSKRSTKGCWPVATAFVRQFTLIVASVILIMIILTIPRNIWMYRLTETRRRKRRALDCNKFALNCRRDYDKIRYLQVSTKPTTPKGDTQSTQSASVKSTETKTKTKTKSTKSTKTAKSTSKASKKSKETTTSAKRQTAGFDNIEPELSIDYTFDADSEGCSL
uniref:Tetraspanin n=2 Tax=Panagrellus redivivus TaxID=6233 RepID=A0A7E4ZVF3_PANRE